MSLQSIKYNKGKLEILNQLLLPLVSEYVEISCVEDGWHAINSMQVRGAPAIAIVGCLSLAVELYNASFTEKNDLIKFVCDKLNFLVTSRPTAVNMAKEAQKLIESIEILCRNDDMSVEDVKTRLLEEIERMSVKDISINLLIGDYGTKAILSRCEPQNKVIVLTHCNTGSLATAGYGTALGVIRKLHELNRIERVYCTETRPYLQGSRLTSYELLYENIPSTLICDSAVAALFKHINVTAVVVGADRVAANGDTANKIGTYQIAVLSKFHGVPFYVCAPLSSVDFTIDSGEEITIEERNEKEITDIAEKRIAAPGMKCWNPAFDVTPASLITGIVTENGVYSPDNLRQVQ